MFFIRSVMLLLFGLGVGTCGTMLGVGGGWLHVPFLMLVFHFSPQMAIGTSIGIIFFNTLAGSIVYYLQRRLDIVLARKLALAVVPGAVLGPFVVSRFDSAVFFVAFSVMLVLIAGLLLFKRAIGVGGAASGGRGGVQRPVIAARVRPEDRAGLGVAGTLVIGFVSNIFGIGGGIIHVPFLILCLQVPTHIALGTSHFILCVSSAIGTAVYASLDYIQVDFMMPIAAGTIIGARIGAELASRLDESRIRRLLVCLLLLLALRMVCAGLQGQGREVPVIHDLPGPSYPMPVVSASV